MIAQSPLSAVAGGACNVICNDANYGFIGAGFCNSISVNTPASPVWYNVIMGGDNNCICNGNYSVIMGGADNEICANYSAILGGCGNCDSGHSFVGIVGCNICANRYNAFFANNYVICDMPSAATGVLGQLFYQCISGAKPLFYYCP